MKNELLVKALGKLDEEMQKGNEAIKRIHEHIEQSLYFADENTLVEIADGKKTLSGAMGAMRTEAKKVAVRNVGVISDSDGFKICDEYFGLGKTKEKPAAVTASIFDLI